MSSFADTIAVAEQAEPAELVDPAVQRAEARLRALEEVREIGLDILRALRREVLDNAERLAGVDPQNPYGEQLLPAAESAAAAAKAAAQKQRDPAAAFDRVSRAVRLTLMLEERADQAMEALRAGVVVRRAEAKVRAARQAAPAGAGESRKDKVKRLVREVADREIEDQVEYDDLLDALDDRLDGDEAYEHLEALPLRETVERLCADLQLTPDWSRWTGDGWPPQPPFFRPRCSYYHTPSRLTLERRMALIE